MLFSGGIQLSHGSAMKTILIPTEDHDAMPAVLEAARLVALAFDSYMEGFAVRPSLASYMTVDPVNSMAISGAFEGDTANQARGEFESFMQTHAVPQGVREPAVFSYGWPREEAAEDAFIGNCGRVFDLIVLGRPGPEPQNPRMPPLEAALFDSGRPVLVVPPSVPQTLARNVLVAWNGSTEQARTNAFAIPLLRLADKVTILTVEGGTTPGPSGEEAACHLRRNDSTDGQVRSAHERRNYSGSRDDAGLRPAGQERLHAEPFASDDLRRSNAAYPRKCHLADFDGALKYL
jgi:hypothetical protein